MSEPSQLFRQGDVLLVPFPYTDRAARYQRPTLVVSNRQIGTRFPLAWVLMITSAKNASWTHDVPIENYRAAGLFDPCVVRVAKIANVELRGARRIGEIEPSVMTQVLAEVQALLHPEND